MFGSDFFQSLQEDTNKTTKPHERPKSPPKSRHDWFERCGITKWPNEEESLSPDSTGTNGILGELEDIRENLMQHAPWDIVFLEDVNKRLSSLEEKLSTFSDYFLYDHTSNTAVSVEHEGLSIIGKKTDPQVFCNPDLLNAMQKPLANHKKNETVDEYGKSVEQAVFLGCHGGVAPLLPSKLEPLPLLDLVTKLQNFRINFLKKWKKFFFSEMSCSVLQCAFWWIWMEKFKPDADQQALLFTLMAENFTSLLIHANDDSKDELFQYYPQCLSQAVFSGFCQGFPRSVKIFHSHEFLQQLCNYIHEWITGIPGPVDCWNSWSMKDLDPSSSTNHTTQSSTQSNTLLHERDLLGASQGIQCQELDNSCGHTLLQPEITRQMSRNYKKEKDESPGIGSGPTFECVRFTTTSRSPLLQHHFMIHGLSESSQVPNGASVMCRTQVKQVPYPNLRQIPSMTFNELLKTARYLSNKRGQAYEREMALYQQQISEAIFEHKLAKKNIQKETKKLLEQRYEVSIQAERIMAKYTSKPPLTSNTLIPEESKH